MTNRQIAEQRLYNQHISYQHFNQPAEIVKYMGAIQAQDYAGAKWAVGLRLQRSSDAAVDQAMATGAIIRIHVLRPTWHFVVPDDLRWMLDLSATRIAGLAAGRYRQLKLDAAVFKKSHDALAKALAGGRHLNRLDIAKVLQENGVETNELRFVHLLMQAELDKVICSGPRMGKQFTYAFFDDQVPAADPKPREEALADLVTRYFTSRGPATAHDFAWWSGLTLAETRSGIETAGSRLTSIKIEGTLYWSGIANPQPDGKSPIAYLLPAFDEYAVGYADRNAIIPPRYADMVRHVIFDPSIILNGEVVGTWKRTIKPKAVDIKFNPFGKLNLKEDAALRSAIKRYEKFVK